MSPVYDLGEAKMVRRLKKRDEDALYDCVDQYGALLKTVISKRSGLSLEDREEVLNEVFYKIWEKIDYYDEKKGSFKQWICAVAHYEALDRLRKILSKEGTLPLDEDILS